jgi:regulator of replication initiation timing
VDAALVAARHDGAYDLGPDVGDFVVSHYKEMPAFTEPHPRSELDTVVTILERVKVLLPSLGGVHEELRTLIVDNNLYELTAENLRMALDIDGPVTLDAVRDNDTVYQYCLSNLSAYLDAIEADGDTNYSTQTPGTLVDALKTAETDNETLERLTATASPDSSLWQLTDASESTWPALAPSSAHEVGWTGQACR